MKLGFIGYGSIAKKHILAINELYNNVEILLIRRNLYEKVENLENITFETSTDINDLEKVEAIFITNPTSYHTNVIQNVLYLNKPLFIEKPLSHSTNELVGIIEKINQSQIITYHACALRFHPCIIYLKEKLLKKIRVNEINIYCGSYLPEWRKDVDFRESYSALASMGGGVHLDLIHEVDFCYYLFGVPISTNLFTSSKSSLSIPAVDYANYLWQYDVFNLQITLNYYRRDYKRTIEIVAEGGTYVIDIKKCSITKDGISIFESDSTPNDWYKLQIDYFMQCVVNNQKCSNDINEAYKVLKLCLNES